MTAIPWNERVCAISIHPDMATREDIARLAADLMLAHRTLWIIMHDVPDPQSCATQALAKLYKETPRSTP